MPAVRAVGQAQMRRCRASDADSSIPEQVRWSCGEPTARIAAAAGAGSRMGPRICAFTGAGHVENERRGDDFGIVDDDIASYVHAVLVGCCDFRYVGPSMRTRPRSSATRAAQ